MSGPNREKFEGAILEVRESDIRCFRLELGCTTIGRSAESSIQLTDASLSARHCEIALGPDGAVIRDLGSTNGTFVAGHPVRIASLNLGEPFRLGSVECVLHQPTPAPASVPQPNRQRPKLDREAWHALAIGLGLAVPVYLVPPLAYIIDFLRVIIHETGHTLTAWVFGYPAIPILRPGGGMSVSLARPMWLLLLLLALLGYLLWQVYRSRRHRILGAVLAGLYLLCLLTTMRMVLITAMGHAFELMVASLFLYRALSGRSILTKGERPLYATVAFVIFALDVRFAARLLLQPEAEADYREEFDGLSHDLVQIADQHLHVPLQSVVLVFLCLTLLAPVGVFLWQSWIRDRSRVAQ